MSLVIRGRVWKFGDNVSTDLMMPGLTYGKGMSEAEMARYCMHANRPGWAEQVQPGDIIIAGRNWGCGSSRPAPRQFKLLGIGGVVADSISRLFFRNAVNVGFPVTICPGVSSAFSEGDEAEVDFETGMVRNLTQGHTLQGEALPPDSPPYALLKAGGLEPLLEEALRRMKAGQPPRPQVAPPQAPFLDRGGQRWEDGEASWA